MDKKIDDWLASIIETADYLRNKVAIPENEDFREALFDLIKESDDALGNAADMVNEFDHSEWS